MSKYKITDKEGSCEFKEYSKKANKLVDCGCSTSVKCGHSWVCINHLANALLTDSKPDMEDHRPDKNNPENKKAFKIIPFVPDFIKLAKGEEVNIRQMSMFDSGDKPEKPVMTEEEKEIRKCNGCTEDHPTERRCEICKGADNQPVYI